MRPAECVDACPGCPHRDLSEEESLRRKGAWLAHALEPWREKLRVVRGPAPSRRWGYRNRALLRAEWRPGEGWRLGMSSGRASASLRKPPLVPIESCPLHTDAVRGVLLKVGKRLPPPERFPLAFVSVTPEALTLVVKDGSARLPELSPAELGVESVWVDPHPSAGKRVFSGKAMRVAGAGTRAGFSQLLPELAGEALKEARDFLAPAPGDLVLDFYSGAGESVEHWLSAGAQSLGVELDGGACAAAEARLGAGRVLRGKAAERLPQLRRALIKERNLVYANPPRTGLEPEVVRFLGEEARPGRMAYLSCSAGTLARDLLTLESRYGLMVESLQPFDFFPQTRQVEVLALLRRVE